MTRLSVREKENASVENVSASKDQTRTRSLAVLFASARISAAIDTKGSSAAARIAAFASAVNAAANPDSREMTAAAPPPTPLALPPTDNSAIITANASAERAGATLGQIIAVRLARTVPRARAPARSTKTASNAASLALAR